ncbi:50S ribosomal protein L32e [Candidatus Pacearchaeota archaeon]|nr:50S ribosomal protein L32e [Candidatus Pacearchaeota archaeon]|tara:strand:+ start:6303 stop:6836 length:534 start_codon:yes stop_codon:yes gene_type:complete
MAKEFLRRNTGEYSRLGLRRKKLQKWRKPKGRDNKMRLRRKGVPKTVEVGYKQDSKTRGKIDGKEIIEVRSLKEIENVGKGKIIILGKVGMKKKIEILEAAKKKGIAIKNFDDSKVREKSASGKSSEAASKKEKKVEKKTDEKKEDKKEDKKDVKAKEDAKSASGKNSEAASQEDKK